MSTATASTNSPPGELVRPWIAKLDDPRESERAVTELEQLGDPGAIDALGRHWTDHGRPVRVLLVMISLARPLTPEQAKMQFVTDYEKTGRPASWVRLLPYLRTAIATIDPGSPRTVDSAVKAADAIGEARLAAGLDELSDLASRPLDKKLFVAQVAATRAIGRLESADGTKLLLSLIERPMPRHPRGATSREEGRDLEEGYGLYLGRTGAAINALGVLPSAQAAEVLILAIYRTPELAMQLRRAIAANGPLVVDHVREILRGKHVAVNRLFKERKLDRYCGDHDERKEAQCEATSTMDFYAGMIAGDLHDRALVPDLIEALKRPAAPAYFIDDAPSPNTQHNALFDALRKLSADEAAAQVRAVWKEPKLDVTLRTLAIGAYPFLARTDVDAGELCKIAEDNTADDGLRQEAATACARLSRSPDQIKLLIKLAQVYVWAAEKKRRTADRARPGTAKADAALAKAEQAMVAAKTKLLQITKDSAATAEKIRAATTSTKKLEETYRSAKKKHKEQTAPYRMLDQAANAYTGYARMFQTHVARIEIAIRCKDDVACYGASLKMTVADAEARVAPHIRDVATWSADEKAGLVDAMIERAMLELGKRGAAAAELTDTLLDAATSDRPIVHESILLALPHIAKLPCPQCVTKLDQAIEAGEGKTTLEALNLETTMLRNYFRWAK